MKSKMLLTLALVISLQGVLFADSNIVIEKQPGYVKDSLVYPDNKPTAQCHAPTLTETKNGLLISWFGGKHENDKSVEIWTAENTGNGWSTPVSVANGQLGKEQDNERYATWNPVLFTMPDGTIILFYKVGPRPYWWWGYSMTSKDQGKTWSKPTALPAGVVGAVKNKPIITKDGNLLCPASLETRTREWNVYFNILDTKTGKWKVVGPCNDNTVQVIQPTLLTYPDGKIQALCRTKQGFMAQFWSDDQGETWSKVSKSGLPNPDSGFDAVTLQDGTQLLVYNNTEKGRTPLNVAVSKDGKTWNNVIVLENEKDGEFSYPAVIQTSDGLVHILYTYKRIHIKHVVLDPKKFTK